MNMVMCQDANLLRRQGGRGADSAGQSTARPIIVAAGASAIRGPRRPSRHRASTRRRSPDSIWTVSGSRCRIRPPSRLPRGAAGRSRADQTAPLHRRRGRAGSRVAWAGWSAAHYGRNRRTATWRLTIRRPSFRTKRPIWWSSWNTAPPAAARGLVPHLRQRAPQGNRSAPVRQVVEVAGDRLQRRPAQGQGGAGGHEGGGVTCPTSHPATTSANDDVLGAGGVTA